MTLCKGNYFLLKKQQFTHPIVKDINHFLLDNLLRRTIKEQIVATVAKSDGIRYFDISKLMITACEYIRIVDTRNTI